MDFKISFSDGFAFFGLAAAIVLVVLDKAGKLKGPLLLVLLAIAILMVVPVAVGNSWVLSPSSGQIRFARGALCVFVLVVIYFALAIWVSSGTASETAEIQPSSGELQARIFPYFPDRLVHLNEKVLARIIWELHLGEVARRPRMSGRIYLMKRSDFPEDADARLKRRPTPAMQKHLIETWKSEYADILKSNTIPEGPPIYASASGQVIAEGPVITQPDVDALATGDQMMFIIGTARFFDSAGEHEAHMCAWLQGAARLFSGKV
jgi:hypothetical protein